MSKIVFKGQTKDGIPYLIRYPKITDVNELHRYINELSKEKTYVAMQGEDISLKDERIWLNENLKKIKEKKTIQLVLETDGKIIGVSGMHPKQRVNSHVGSLAISIAKDFRGKGLGKKLIESLLEETKNNLTDLRIIHLECFANNESACSLYRSVGFKEYGKLPGGISYKGDFVDEVLMYKEI